jgi:thiol-disulfide isomerase/thioredoxin
MRWPRFPHRTLGGIISAAVLCGLLTSCGGDESIVEPEPPASLSELFGPVLYKANGDSVGIEAVEGKAIIIAIYFSARWCPACAGFTPQLLSAYQELEQAGKSFEVVLVSLDDNSQEMFAHMMDYDMPWLAVPYGGEKANGLIRRYAVAWIPTLIVVDGEGRTLSVTGREEVASKGAGAYEDWLDKGA